MRFRLLRRRLTISAPTMAIRSSTPWPLRWALAAVVLGFCAAIALWAFEFGKDIAGIDRHTKEEVVQLRDEVERLKAERDKARAEASGSTSLITAERAAQSALAGQLKALEAENRQLRDDLGFFEKLIPAGSAEGLSIRGLTAELPAPGQVKWQFLLVLAGRKVPQFDGKYELIASGQLQGKTWSQSSGLADVSFKQVGRMQGLLDVPPQAVVKTVTLKVMEGNTQRAIQTFKF